MAAFWRFMELLMYYMSFSDAYVFKIPGLQLRADALRLAQMPPNECRECLAVLQALPDHRFPTAVRPIVATVVDDLQQKAGATP